VNALVAEISAARLEAIAANPHSSIRQWLFGARFAAETIASANDRPLPGECSRNSAGSIN
jgi:hypothetical protein